MTFLSGVIVGGIGMALWYTIPAALAFRDVFQSGRDVLVIETTDSAETHEWRGYDA